MTSTTVLDGGILEGGGQVLRNAAALAALLGKRIVVENIRAGRPNPGLHAQHLTGLELVQQISNGTLQGGEKRSSRIDFEPRKLGAGNYVADTETAGSVGLLIQISLPTLLFGPARSYVTLRGGTNADFAPQIDYFTRVFIPVAGRLFGIPAAFDVVRRGYYPKGQGEVKLTVTPVNALKPINLVTKGNVTRVHVWSFVAGTLPESIAQRTAKACLSVLNKQFGRAVVDPPEVVVEPPHKAVGSGSGILCWLETDTGCIIAGSAIGAKGKQAEQVGIAAADMLMANHRHGGCVDEYLQDQLIIFMALADGESRVLTGPLTLHTETAIHFVQQLSGAQFTVTKASDDPKDTRFFIACKGIGLRNTNDGIAAFHEDDGDSSTAAGNAASSSSR